MNEKIAMGFHTCIDYELIWNIKIIKDQIEKFDIHKKDLNMDMEALSERDIWIISLAHLKAGIGCEIIPQRNELCEKFAKHFRYKITLGGTSTRAAIAVSHLHCPSLIQTSCYNKYVRKLLPKNIRLVPGIKEDETIYPHVVLQCNSGVRIKANDIDFITPRENRILISCDKYSLELPVLEKEFGREIRECKVFLSGSFTEISDFEILKDRIEKTYNLLSYLPKDAIVVMEDGHYIKEKFRDYIHNRLSDCIDILSMNEDELQKYVGHRINIMECDEVVDAVKYVYEKVKIKNILIHSAAWAIVYGKNASKLYSSLEGGITMAATRFRKGDEFDMEDYLYTKTIKNKIDSEIFCMELQKKYGDKICCLPSKDMSFVKKPTVVGLGDAFVGGLLPELLKINQM